MEDKILGKLTSNVSQHLRTAQADMCADNAQSGEPLRFPVEMGNLARFEEYKYNIPMLTIYPHLNILSSLPCGRYSRFMA